MTQVPLVRDINIAVKGPFLVHNLHLDCDGSVDITHNVSEMGRGLILA